MRIALLHPTYWPEVRRGSERLVHDLAASLAARGHQVTVHTSHRGSRSDGIEDGVRVVRHRRLGRLPGLDWYDEHAAAAPGALCGLLRGDYELAHALYPLDAWAARLALRCGGPPYLFSIHGIVNRRYLVARRHRLEVFMSAARDAALVSALSEAAAAPLRRYALAEPRVLPGGVIGADFTGEVSRPHAPTLLCASSLGDPRKGGELLLDAFGLLRRRLPSARLLLAGGRDPFAAPEPAALAEGLVRIDASPAGALARAYRSVSATVLPAADEAFGLVLIESLAAGTPVVAARSGAGAEIVTDERIGRLFEPGDPASLAAAMKSALDLTAAGDGVTESCRAHASRWDWSRVVLEYEAAYEAALAA